MDNKLVDIVNKKIKQMNETENSDVFYSNNLSLFRKTHLCYWRAKLLFIAKKVLTNRKKIIIFI